MNNSPAAVSSFSECCVGKKQTTVELFQIFTGHKIRVLAAYVSILVISEAISCWVLWLASFLAYLLVRGTHPCPNKPVKRFMSR